MIPMRQFLRDHQISGEVVEYAPEPQAERGGGSPSYRVTLTHSGQLRAFEAQIRRPPGAPVPTVGEALAEVARRISASGQRELPGAGDSADVEARRLQLFMGERAYAELLFEFGHRPEAQVENDDTVGDPARPDEMTNQEPTALVEAGDAARMPTAVRYLVGVPVVVLASAGILLMRGRRAAAFCTAVGGTLATVGGATMAAVWRRRHRRQSVKRTLQILTDQNAAIQRGEASR
jgi:hypothetical protein